MKKRDDTAVSSDDPTDLSFTAEGLQLMRTYLALTPDNRRLVVEYAKALPAKKK